MEKYLKPIFDRVKAHQEETAQAVADWLEEQVSQKMGSVISKMEASVDQCAKLKFSLAFAIEEKDWGKRAFCVVGVSSVTAKLKVSSDPRTVFSCAVDGQRALPGMEEAGADATEAADGESDGAREGKRILRRLVSSGKMTIEMPKEADKAIREAGHPAARKSSIKSCDDIAKIAAADREKFEKMGRDGRAE